MTYVGRGVDAISNVEKLDNITFSGTTTYNLTKSSVAFTPSGANNILISIDGVVQQNNFTVSGSTIIFDWSPASSNTCNWIQHYGTGVLNVPADGTITASKMADNSIDSDSYVDGSIDIAHIADDAITTDKLANSINTAITANTAKTSNATHSGEVTGATALTIADNIVDEANLKVSNAPTNGYMLTAQSGNTGGMTWASGAFVSLGSASGTTDVANITFDNVFSDTYTRYMMMVDYMLPASANVEMRYNWRKSDSSDQSGGYTYSGLELRQGTTDEFSQSSGGATNFGVLTHNIQTGNGEHGVRALFDIYRPSTVDSNATMHYIVGRGTYRSYDNDAVQAAHFYVSSNNYNTTAFTGIKVYFNSGNVNSYKIRMYGVVT